MKGKINLFITVHLHHIMIKISGFLLIIQDKKNTPDTDLIKQEANNDAHEACVPSKNTVRISLFFKVFANPSKAG